MRQAHPRLDGLKARTLTFAGQAHRVILSSRSHGLCRSQAQIVALRRSPPASMMPYIARWMFSTNSKRITQFPQDAQVAQRPEGLAGKLWSFWFTYLPLCLIRPGRQTRRCRAPARWERRWLALAPRRLLDILSMLRNSAVFFVGIMPRNFRCHGCTCLGSIYVPNNRSAAWKKQRRYGLSDNTP
jgi:hypothetical protein